MQKYKCVYMNLPFSRLTGKELTSAAIKLCSCPASTGWKQNKEQRSYTYEVFIRIWFIKQMTFSIYSPSGLKEETCIYIEKSDDGLQTYMEIQFVVE